MRPAAPLDWESLATAWSGQKPPTALRSRLERRIRRQTLWMRLTLVTEVLVFVALAWFSRRYLGFGPSPLQVFLLAITWVWAVAIQAVAVWNRRMSWRADSEGAGGYLRLLERRGHARLNTARLVPPLVLVQGVIVFSLLVFGGPGGSTGTGATIAWGCGLALAAILVALGWARWWGGRARRDLEELAEARRLLAEDAE